MSKIRQTVDTCADDREFVARLEKNIDMLCGMVVEMVEENRACLLSGVMRELLANKAKEVATAFRKVKGRIAVDNPGDPL